MLAKFESARFHGFGVMEETVGLTDIHAVIYSCRWEGEGTSKVLISILYRGLYCKLYTCFRDSYGWKAFI